MLFEEYDTYHTHPLNQLTHKIGIPLIFFNAIAMLDWIVLYAPASTGLAFPGVTVAQFVLIACSIWYLRMSIRLGLITVATLWAFMVIGWYTPVWAVIVAGIAGWAVQFAGHIVWEKSAPNFARNGIQSLVGPIYFIALATGDWRAPAWRGGEATRSAQ